MMNCRDRPGHLKQELEDLLFFFLNLRWIVSFIFNLLLLTINCTCEIFLHEKKPFVVAVALVSPCSFFLLLRVEFMVNCLVIYPITALLK